jgi:hypothetical protein
MGGKGNKKRNISEINSEKVSPPNKMTRNQVAGGFEPSTSDLMERLNAFELRFNRIDSELAGISKFVREFEMMKDEVRESCDGFRRLEIEGKKRSVLIKGLPFKSAGQYETRKETKEALVGFFTKIGMGAHLVDYQRLGGLKEGENGSKVPIRVQFADVDLRFEMFDKLKVKGSEMKDVSVLTDYPDFQIPEFKRLSNIAYRIRKDHTGTRTRIVPRGLKLLLQTRANGEDKWKTVSSNGAQGGATPPLQHLEH